MAEIVDDARAHDIPMTEVCADADVSRQTVWRYQRNPPEPIRAMERLRLAVRKAKRARGKDVADD